MISAAMFLLIGSAPMPMLQVPAAVGPCAAEPAEPAHTGPESSRPLALEGVTLIDGTGAPPRPGQTVLVLDGRIAEIFETGTRPLPDGAIGRDCSGHTLLPGLIDGHVHLRMAPDPEGALRAMLQSGVTTVRELAGDVRLSRALARRAAAGESEAPAIYYSAVLFGPKFLADPRPRALAERREGEDEPWLGVVHPGGDVADIIARARATGSTGVKLYASLDAEMLAALTTEAHRQGLRVWSHSVTFPGTPRDAVAAGADALIHSKGLIFEGRDDVPDNFAEGVGGGVVHDFDGADPESPPFTVLFAEMVRRGTVLEPALMADGDLSPRPLTDGERAVRDWACRATGAAFRAGVTIGAGTDTPARAGMLVRELERLVECGVPPLAAIQAATLNNARAIGIDATHGTVERGKVADLLLIGGDPLADIRALGDVRLVMKAGREVPLAPR